MSEMELKSEVEAVEFTENLSDEALDRDDGRFCGSCCVKIPSK